MTETSPTTAGPDGSNADGAAPDDTAYDVPPDASVAECEYCGRPFESEGLLALHRGRAHESAISAAERTAYEEAYEAESGQLGRFRLKALAALVLVYFGLLIVYAVV
ncbi:C2H2-type zinc finger protein [Halosimplex litoreum]|uniref:C2H2-type zinc finger protein n=1 Tax=Halosimplex litoreum TaxID=1198301 RepID=UPI001E64D817|nr:C2H2-type zinc finger protein [Halosimplex litoreum]